MGYWPWPGVDRVRHRIGCRWSPKLTAEARRPIAVGCDAVGTAARLCVLSLTSEGRSVVRRTEAGLISLVAVLVACGGDSLPQTSTRSLSTLVARHQPRTKRTTRPFTRHWHVAMAAESSPSIATTIETTSARSSSRSARLSRKATAISFMLATHRNTPITGSCAEAPPACHDGVHSANRYIAASMASQTVQRLQRTSCGPIQTCMA